LDAGVACGARRLSQNGAERIVRLVLAARVRLHSPDPS
jgi:hypothetical protein